MSEGLREVDDRIGRCYHCNKLIFKGENFVIPQFLAWASTYGIAHPKCDSEHMLRASQI